MPNVFPEAVAGAKDVARRYFDAWLARNYGDMAALTQKTWAAEREDAEVSIKALCGTSRLVEYSLREMTVLSAVSVRIGVDYREEIARGVFRSGTTAVMVIRESAPFVPDEVGDWGVNPLSFFCLNEAGKIEKGDDDAQA